MFQQGLGMGNGSFDFVFIPGLGRGGNWRDSHILIFLDGVLQVLLSFWGAGHWETTASMARQSEFAILYPLGTNQQASSKVRFGFGLFGSLCYFTVVSLAHGHKLLISGYVSHI